MPKKETIIRYGISLGLDTDDLARDAREANQVTRRLNREMGRTQATMRKYKKAVNDLRTEFRAGRITREQYLEQLQRERKRRDKGTGALERYRRKQRQVNAEKKAEAAATAAQIKLERALNAERARAAALKSKRFMQIGGAAAGGLSAMGMGGKAAGAARAFGGFAAMRGTAAGLGGAAIAGVGVYGLMKTSQKISSSIDVYEKLETKLTDIKVLFGDLKGEKLYKEFRNLARDTALTTDQLTSNAKLWKSYGLTTNNMTDRLRRLGEVAGGNTEQFTNLTRAFAQVNAMGKLMGQEKNQLVNAGFSLAEIAKVAGVEMEDFAKAMEDGAISAEHVNQALINVTNEGGLFYGRLDERAKTLEGRATMIAGKWEEVNAAIGENFSGWRHMYLSANEAMADLIGNWTRWANSTEGRGFMGFSNMTDKMEFGMYGDNTKMGAWGGSYSMQNGLRSHVYSMSNDKEASIFQIAMGGLFGFGSPDLKNKRLNHERQLAMDRLDKSLLTGAPDSERQRAETPEARRERMRLEKEKLEAEKEHAAEQLEHYKRLKEQYMFLDPSRGGADKNDLRRKYYEIFKSVKAGEMTEQQGAASMRDAKRDYEIRLANDRREAEREKREKAQEARQKVIDDRKAKFDNVMKKFVTKREQMMSEGFTGQAADFLIAQEEKLSALGRNRQEGSSGFEAGNGSEYEFLSRMQQERDDRLQKIRHQNQMEVMTKAINKNTKDQLDLMRRQGRLFSNDSAQGGQAV